MKLTIKKVNYEEIELDDRQMRDVALAYFKKFFPHSGIQYHNKKLWVYEWEDTGHGSGLTNYIREATEKDKFINKVMDFIIDDKKAK